MSVGTSAPKVSVVTVVSGRHDHLRAQRRGLAASSVTLLDHVVVAMGDTAVDAVVGECAVPTRVVDVAVGDRGLPLAAARNLGARAAIEGGADLVVFLDVDCIPAPTMIAGYVAAAQTSSSDSLLCGPVTYLPPRVGVWTVESLLAATDPHPARPNPAPGVVEPGTNIDLFWSLSFAVTPATWHRVGGFCEEYRGYGAEDTDFAVCADAVGIRPAWVGGAHAYHQHHPVSRPPVEHLDDIVANATIFFHRWGRWPMTGWLDEFERRGLIIRSDDTITIRHRSATNRASRTS